jgi:hypothetical protein
MLKDKNNDLLHLLSVIKSIALILTVIPAGIAGIQNTGM